MSRKGISCLLAAVLALTACSGPQIKESQQVPAPKVVKPVTHDDEVFYFPVTGDDYRASLSAFRKVHPDLRCRYFGADDRVGRVEGYNRHHTLIVGHTIVCTDTAKNAQDETVP